MEHTKIVVYKKKYVNKMILKYKNKLGFIHLLKSYDRRTQIIFFVQKKSFYSVLKLCSNIDVNYPIVYIFIYFLLLDIRRSRNEVTISLQFLD